MPKKWWPLGLILAPVALALAFFARSQGVVWFLVFWVLVMTWVVLFWVVILPRWLRAQPLARKYEARPARSADVAAAPLWQAVGGIRLPSGLGGLNAGRPFARLLAYDDGVRLEPTLKWMSVIPSLSLEWAALERIEAVGRRGIRVRIKDPATALLFFALADRDRLLDIVEQRGVAVDRSRRRNPWFVVG
jgi:hypothetical protein